MTKEEQARLNFLEREYALQKEINEERELGRMSTERLNQTFAQIVNDLGKGSVVQKEISKSFRSITSSAQKLLSHEEGISKLSSQQLKSLRQKYQQNLQSLKTQSKLTGKTKEDRDAKAEAVALLEDGADLNKDFTKALTEQYQTRLKIEKTIGVTGQALKGIAKIPILGDLVDATAAVEDATIAAENGASRVGTMFAGFKSLGGTLAENLLDPLVVGTTILTGTVKLLKEVDTLTSGTARNFGISTQEALKLNTELREIGQQTGDAFNNVFRLNKTLNTVNETFGTSAEFSDKLLTDFNELNNKAGISEKALQAIQKATMVSGEELKKSTEEFKGQVALQNAKNGLALNEAQILEEIQNTSSAITVSLGGSASAIADAIFKAKSLGLELKDLESISSSLLNFQSSIEDELSAELLTGKQLNLEGARYAALMNDQATLAEELAKNIGTAADFQAMNNIEQQAYAKAVGMSREQLANTLIQREALNKLDAKGNTLQEKYNNLLAAGKSEEYIRQQLGNDALNDQLKSVSNAERLSATMESFKAALLPIAEKIMPMISSAITFASENMGTLLIGATALVGVMTALAAAQITAAFVANPIAATVGAALAAGAIGTLMTSTKIGDGDFPARGKSLISTKEGGLFQPSINDDIVVAPGASQALRQGGTQKVENKVSIAPSNTNITLNLNGAAIGNANARQNYGVGKNVKALGGNVDYSASI